MVSSKNKLAVVILLLFLATLFPFSSEGLSLERQRELDLKRGKIVQETKPTLPSSTNALQSLQDQINSLQNVLQSLINKLAAVDTAGSSQQNESLSSVSKSILDSQERYSLELDVPSYLDQSLRHPRKFFSGRKIRIIDKQNKLAYPASAKLVLRNQETKASLSEKPLDIKKKGKGYFVFEIPKDAGSGYYTFDFEIGASTYTVPVEVYGLDTEEQNHLTTNLTQSLDPNILRIGCNWCFWESVLATNPVNSSYGYFMGGGARDYLVTTNDGWETSQTLSIDNLTNAPKLNFRGDPKLSFDKNGRLTVASLLYNANNYSDPITGGLFSNLNNLGETPSFKQTNLLPIPPTLEEGTWIIFDYPKITVDINPVSQFFGNTYVFANNANFGDGSGVGQGVFVVDSAGNISKRKRTEGDWWNAVTSAVVGKNGEVYIAYPTVIYAMTNPIRLTKVAKSVDGGRSFSEYTINNSGIGYCPGRVSSQSNRSWYIYWGPEIAVDKDGVLYAAWAQPEECRQDSNFEYGLYGYDYNVYLSYSTNGGVEWENPIKVNNDNSGGDQGFPSIEVDSNGDVYIAFLDHRDNQDLSQFDVYLAKFNKSTNSLPSNIKVNDLSVPNDIGGRDPGDYLDMLGFTDDKILVAHPCVNPDFPNIVTPSDACIAKVDKSYSTCADSDGGRVYNTKGTTSLMDFTGTTSYQDTCTTSNNLKEYYCNASKTASSENYYCTYGCSYGKCNPNPNPPPSCYIDPKTKKKVCNNNFSASVLDSVQNQLDSIQDALKGILMYLSPR